MYTSPPDPVRLVGPASLAAGVLIAANQLYGHLAHDPERLVEVVNTPAVIAYSMLNIVAFFLLLVSLVGLYTLQVRVAGKFGLVAFLLALFGTMLVAGDVWFETFVVPMVAQGAPELVGTFHPLFITGALLTFGSFSLGWVLFGIASFRARYFPRPASALLTVGAMLGYLPLTTPHLVVFGLALSWMGYLQLAGKTSG
jgi:hypothetical protein